MPLFPFIHFPPFLLRDGFILTFSLETLFQELEIALDEERRRGEDARQAALTLERRRAALQAELDDVRALLEAVSNRTNPTSLCMYVYMYV